MRFFKYIIAFIFSIFFLTQAQPLWANNLAISNVSLECLTGMQTANTRIVEFDITWDNSWRDSTNMDGVWVFLKVCKNTCSEWVHGKMAASGAPPADTSGGSASLSVVVPTDMAGAFLYRNGNGTGTVTSTNVRLKFDYQAAPLSANDSDNIQVRVFGIEMVQVPVGRFYVGPNADIQPTYGYFYDVGDSVDPRAAVLVTSAVQPWLSQVSAGGTAGDITWAGSAYVGSRPASRSQLSTYFPTGAKGFWIMKYELTQGMYRDFLNTLTTAATTKRTYVKTNNYYAMNGNFYVTLRQGVEFKSSGTPFICDLDDDTVGNETVDGEWVAMNYMIWQDCAAVADWMGLRPLTEFEFEKVGHGTAEPPGPRIPCGGTIYSPVWNPIYAAGTNSEYIDDREAMGCLINCVNYGGSSEIDAPLRVGFQATSTSTRTTSAASEYGVMELGGNVGEYYVTVGNSSGRGFQGSHGDGALTTTSDYEGNATNTDWPGIDGTATRGVTGATGSGCYGSNFAAYCAYVPVENRIQAAYAVDNRTSGTVPSSMGCRVGRDL